MDLFKDKLFQCLNTGNNPKYCIEKSTEEDFQSLVRMGGEMGIISGNN